MDSNLRQILIEKWATLGPSSVSAERISEAQAALASTPPTAPERPPGLVTSEVAQAYAESSRAYDVGLATWHLSYAGIFHDPSVLAKLAILNASTVEGPRQTVEISAVMEYLRANNLWLQIKAAQATCQGAAAAVDYNADPRATHINFELPTVQAMINDLVSHGLLTQDQADHINAMSITAVPWWQANGFPGQIGTGDLEAIFVESGEVLV